MILSDTKSNTEFSFIFIKKFKWESPSDNEQNGGHPMKGRVYRMAKNTDTGTYRIFFPLNQGLTALVIPSLESHPEGYTSDIAILSNDNLLDFNIKEDDVDKLLGWLKSSNEEVKRMMGIDVPVQTQLMKFIEMISPISNEEVEDFIKTAKTLNDINPQMFNSLHDFMDYAIHQENEFSETSLTSSMLTLSKTHGSGANLIGALTKLSKYISEDRRTNLDENDLMGAITDLLNEQSRRTFNEIQ